MIKINPNITFRILSRIVAFCSVGVLCVGCVLSTNTDGADAIARFRKDSVALSGFLKSPCDSFQLDLNHIYPEFHNIPDDKNESLIILDSLKKAGFTVIRSGRGNWEGGPRIVTFSVSNYFCDCEIDKKYHLVPEVDKYRATEHVTCKNRKGDLNHFIPEAYEILDSVSGRVNRDTLTDVILVLKRKKELACDEKRFLVLLMKTESGYEFHSKNEDYLLSWDRGGQFNAPYDGMEWDNQELIIRHFGGSSWRWLQEIRFSFDVNRDAFIPTLYTNRSFWSIYPDSTMRVDSITAFNSDTTFTHFVNPYNQQ